MRKKNSKISKNPMTGEPRCIQDIFKDNFDFSKKNIKVKKKTSKPKVKITSRKASKKKKAKKRLLKNK